jgi:predicted membrane channel-forming protein YqfA (hemolysin III family)
MAKSKYKQIRGCISLIYILTGVSSVVQAFDSLIALDHIGIFASALGVLIFIAGICGFFSIKPRACHTLGFIIMILSLASLVYAIVIEKSFNFNIANQFLLSWLFMLCV